LTRNSLNALHGLLNCEIGGLDGRVIITESIKPVSILYTCITYFAMHWSMLLTPYFQLNIRIQYKQVE